LTEEMMRELRKRVHRRRLAPTLWDVKAIQLATQLKSSFYDLSRT